MDTQAAALGSNQKTGFLRFIKAFFLPPSWKIEKQTEQLSKKQIAIRLLQKLTLYYLLFCPLVAMQFYTNCIFHPLVLGDFSNSKIDGITGQNIFFKSSDGTRLHGWYFFQPKARKTVLISHGNAGNLTHRRDLVNLLLATGASVFIYDYRGFGLSKGSPGVNESCNDGIAAFDYLNKSLKTPASSIVLYGESLGTGISAQIASKRTVSGVILQSAFRSLPQIAREKMPLFAIYPDAIFPVNTLDTLQFVRGEHPPLLIIHGKDDALISDKNAEELFKEASGSNKTLAICPQAGHNDVYAKLTEEAVSALHKFCN